MTSDRPATPAERTAMSRRLVTAADLGDRHIGRQVRIGAVEGRLTAMYGVRDRINLVVDVGGSEAIFPLDGGAHVEVWRVVT